LVDVGAAGGASALVALLSGPSDQQVDASAALLRKLLVEFEGSARGRRGGHARADARPRRLRAGAIPQIG
jgi:hypothetical protein